MPSNDERKIGESMRDVIVWCDDVEPCVSLEETYDALVRKGWTPPAVPGEAEERAGEPYEAWAPGHIDTVFRLMGTSEGPPPHVLGERAEGWYKGRDAAIEYLQEEIGRPLWTGTFPGPASPTGEAGDGEQIKALREEVEVVAGRLDDFADATDTETPAVAAAMRRQARKLREAIDRWAPTRHALLAPGEAREGERVEKPADWRTTFVPYQGDEAKTLGLTIPKAGQGVPGTAVFPVGRRPACSEHGAMNRVAKEPLYRCLNCNIGVELSDSVSSEED